MSILKHGTVRVQNGRGSRLGAGGVGRGGWVAGVDINMDMGGWSTTTALKIDCLLTVSGSVVAGTVQCWNLVDRDILYLEFFGG